MALRNGRLRIVKWHEYQHDKRRPLAPWIKWYRQTLENALMMEPIEVKGLWPYMLLIAAPNDGCLDFGPYLAHRLCVRPALLERSVNRLIQLGLIEPCEHDASTMLATCAQDASLDKERDRDRERDKELCSPDGERDRWFDQFWTIYPRKVGKQAARKAWAKVKPDADLMRRIVEAVTAQRRSEQWQRDAGSYIPHPATWLNGARWEDELKTETAGPRPLEGWTEAEKRAAREARKR